MPFAGVREQRGAWSVWEGEIAWVWVSENINHFLPLSVCKSIHSAVRSVLLKGSKLWNRRRLTVSSEAVNVNLNKDELTSKQ